MKIKALVEIGEEEIEKEVELPYYYRDRGKWPEDDFMVHTKIEADKITTISYRKEYNETDLYDVKIEPAPTDWMTSYKPSTLQEKDGIDPVLRHTNGLVSRLLNG